MEPIIKYIFYPKTFDKRVRLHFFSGSVTHVHCDKVCENTEDTHYFTSSSDDCDCDLYCKLVQPCFQAKNIFVVNRFLDEYRKTTVEMYDEIFSQIASYWWIESNVKRGAVCHNVSSLRDYVSRRVPANQTEIAPLFRTATTLSNKTLHVPHFLFPIYKSFDVRYLSSILGSINVDYLRKYVWKEVRRGDTVYSTGVPWKIDYPHYERNSLQALCLQKLSTFNMAFGGDTYGPYANYTMHNLAEKIPRLMDKFDSPSHKLNAKGLLEFKHVSESLELMYATLGFEKFKDSQTFTWDSTYLDDVVIPSMTSTGSRAGPSADKRARNGVLITYTVNGIKVCQKEYAKSKIEELVAAFKYDSSTDFELDDIGWKVTFKTEVLYGTTDAERKKFLHKVRMYYIPGVVYYILSQISQGFRQKNERCDWIRIGMNWFSGGALRLAIHCRYLDPQMVYGCGDFSGFDISLKIQFLMLYSSMAAYYYNNKGDKKLFLFLLGHSAKHLCAKTMNIFDDIWRVMFGVMPSGAYQTSHGDSWCVILMYFMYFLHCMRKYPHAKHDILDSIKATFTHAVASGDDSILVTIRKIAKYVNIYGFQDYVRESFDMIMRDVEQTCNFLTEPNTVTGGILSKGVVFLSRYSVPRHTVTNRTDIAQVLPYRPLSKLVCKFAYGTGNPRNSRDYILASIGMVYDSMGTNDWAYKFFHFAFSVLMRMEEASLEEVIDSVSLERDSSLLRILRKLNISKDELLHGFPTQKRLLSNHVYNQEAHAKVRSATDLYGRYY